MFSSKKNRVSENRITPVECKRVSSSTAIGGEGETLFHTIFAQEYVTDGDFQKMINMYGRDITYINLTKGDINGNTPVHLAAQSGNANFIRNSFKHFNEDLTYILALPIVCNNEEGKTPLHLAVDGEHLECTEVLIKYIREYVNMQDIQGRTPLHNAILFKKNIGIAKELLKYPHINTEIEDNDGNNVYDCIKRSADKQILNLFIDYYSNKKKEAELKFENAGRAAKNSEYLSRICNDITVGFSAVGGLVALICECISAYGTVDECECNTASNYKTTSVILASMASLLFPCALFLHYWSSNCKNDNDLFSGKVREYKEKHDLLGDKVKECEARTRDLVTVENMFRQDSVNEKTCSNIITQLQQNLYTRQVRSAEVSTVLTNIQESDPIQRTVSCVTQIYRKKISV